MGEEITYRAIVLKDLDEQPFCLVLYDYGLNFFPISDHEEIYSHMSLKEGSICAIKFFDGTESVDYKYVLDNNFEDIIFHIKDIAIVDVKDGGNCIFEHIVESYENTRELWDFIDEIFSKNDRIKEEFETYKKEKAWGETH